MLGLVLNLWMLLSAFLAVALLNYDARTQRWGALAGLCGMPAWLYISHLTGHQGLFNASLFFTVCFGTGVCRGFVSPGPRNG